MTGRTNKQPWNRPNGFAFLTALLGVAQLSLLILLGLSFLTPGVAQAAPSEAALKRTLQAEEQKAKARRDKIVRLTSEERGLSQDLAEAEKKVLELDSQVEEQEKKLALLNTAEEDVKLDYNRLLKEKAKTETAMRETMRLLWELASREEAVGFKDLPDWPVLDREYTWGKELFSLLATQQATLAEQTQSIASTLGKREALAAEARKQLRVVNADKNKLLKSQLSYRSKLSQLRKDKKAAEDELGDIVALIKDLNIKIESAAEKGSFDNFKGKLPQPVSGVLKKRFSPGSAPPVRGVGFSSADKAEVRAVAYGKVVHDDILRGFGRVVIVMHNNSYYTLYAYLSDSKVNVGDEISRGQAIGRTGYYPDLGGPGLYFELRSHQKTVNPEIWFN